MSASSIALSTPSISSRARRPISIAQPRLTNAHNLRLAASHSTGHVRDRRDGTSAYKPGPDARTDTIEPPSAPVTLASVEVAEQWLRDRCHRDRRLQPLPHGAGVHGLRRLVPAEHSSGERRRQGLITKVGNAHVRRLLVEPAWHARRPDRRLRARPPPARPGRAHPRARLALPAAAAWPLAEDGRPRQALAKDRRRLRPRTRRLRLGDRDRATAHKRLSQSKIERRMRLSTRRTLEASMRRPHR
jgi:hypothetical protein